MCFWIKTAYMADTFTLCNETNKWMKGPESSVIQCKDALDAFVCTLDYRLEKMWNGEVQHFPLLLKQSAGTVFASLRAELTWHLNLLREEIKNRFTDVSEYLKKEAWVLDPYISTLKDVEYLSCEDELCDLKADSLSKEYFQENGYKKFWIVKGQTVAP